MKNKSIFFMIVVSVFLIGNLFLINANGDHSEGEVGSHNMMMNPIEAHPYDSDFENSGFMQDGFMGGFGFMPGGIYGLLIILLVIVILILLVIYLIKMINEPVKKKEQKAENKQFEEADKSDKESNKINKKEKE